MCVSFYTSFQRNSHNHTLAYAIVLHCTTLFFIYVCVCQRINKLRNGSTLPIHKNFTRRDISVVHTKSSLGLFSFVVVVVVVFRLRRIPFRQRNWMKSRVYAVYFACGRCVCVAYFWHLRDSPTHTHTHALILNFHVWTHFPTDCHAIEPECVSIFCMASFFRMFIFRFLHFAPFIQASLWAAAFGNWKMLTYALNFPKTQRKCVIPIELIDMRVYLCVPYALRKGITHQSISLYVMSVVNVECALKVTHTRRVWMKPLKMVHNYNANTNIQRFIYEIVKLLVV